MSPKKASFISFTENILIIYYNLGVWGTLRRRFSYVRKDRFVRRLHKHRLHCLIRYFLLSFSKYFTTFTKLEPDPRSVDAKQLVHRSCKEISACLEFLELEFTGLQIPCALSDKTFRPILSIALYYVRQCPYTLYISKEGFCHYFSEKKKKKNELGNSCLAEFESQQNILFFFLYYLLIALKNKKCGLQLQNMHEHLNCQKENAKMLLAFKPVNWIFWMVELYFYLSHKFLCRNINISI